MRAVLADESRITFVCDQVTVIGCNFDVVQYQYN
jgi:hypothetical protein